MPCPASLSILAIFTVLALAVLPFPILPILALALLSTFINQLVQEVAVLALALLSF